MIEVEEATVDVAGASLPEAVVMADVGKVLLTVPEEVGATEETGTEVAEPDVKTTDSPGLDVTPPPKSSEMSDCAWVDGVVARRAAAEKARAAARLCFIV